jgi:tryptophan halogenase
MDIVICGGGTAGWLSAFIIAQANPHQHNITVVESSKIGIVGAGEASSGLIVDILSGN